MAPRRFVGWTLLLCLTALVAGSSARAEPPPGGEAGGAEEEVFHYPLRAGESLTDVSRFFRIPVQDLMELNHITDPNHLSIGQTLSVPNSFARDASALRSERDRLLAEKQQIERESTERQRAVANLESRTREIEGEKATLSGELAATTHWHRAANLFFVLLVLILAWALKARADRAFLARKLRIQAAENAALRIAKEKVQRAASQLELRCQRLYRGKGEAPAEVIAEGISRMSRAFGEGTAQIELRMTELTSEEKKEQRLFGSERRALASLFQRGRGFFSRRRLKYHTP